MEIDNNVVDLFADRKAKDASKDLRESSREKWLSALEKESFGISDDTLKDHDSAEQRGDLPPEFGGPQQQGQILGRPDTPAEILARQGMSQGQAKSPSAFAPPAQGFSPGLSSLLPQAVPGQPGSVSADVLNRQAARPGITMSSPGFAQRYEALLSQTRFMDVNIQITQSKDGLTLWIRDFKNKYANEVFQWTQSLDNLLRERGQSITRIMLNGKAITTIASIFGGEHGN